MTGHYHTTTALDGADDQPIVVTYRTWPARKGKRDGRGGPPLEPDEPAGIEIERVERDDGREVTLLDEAEGRLLEEICEWLAGQEAAAREDAADARREECHG